MDINLFDGLEDMGLGDMMDVSLFGDDGGKKVAELQEEAMLIDKSYECFVCSSDFKCKTVRSGKAKLLSTDTDLRQKYEGIEPLKYDIVACPECGFAAATRFFNPLSPGQVKLIREKISANYKKQEDEKSLIDFDEAIKRYKLALANTVVKKGPDSEKAYICLRAGWLCRSYAEEIASASVRDDEKYKSIKALEDEFLKGAYEGFVNSRNNEIFPICGMDKPTVDYLVACLACRFGFYDVSAKVISTLLSSSSVPPRVKDRARDLKEELMHKVKS